MKVIPVPVRQDNYAYLLVDHPSNDAAAVDPYDVQKIQAAAEANGVRIVAGITTHHHHDHSGGNEKFAATFPGVPIYGGSHKIPALSHPVADSDEFTLGTSTRVRCLATPCHTQDSICFHATAPGHPGAVFTGDTLFVGGCGRFFEGTAAQMVAALAYLRTLPPATQVYQGHEYTAGNAAFARSVAGARDEGVAALERVVREHDQVAGVTTIGEEGTWNVFMQLGSEAVRNAAGVSADASDEAVMDKLREMKNNFTG